jgi:hypothetical protein
MTVQALNQLLGRSTIEPAILEAFEAGRIDELLGHYGFAPEMRKRLGRLEAETFAEFALLAYRVVQEAEQVDELATLPSPTEGLRPGQRRQEQVA